MINSRTGSGLFRRVSAFVAEAPRAPGVYAAAIAIVTVGAGLAWLLETYFGTTRLSAIFLGSVVVVAMRLGAHAAVLGAIFAAIFFNLFLRDPRFTLSPLSPEEIVNLALFTFVALAIGGLAGRARDEERKLREREQSIGLLFEASRDMSSTADEAALLQRLAEWSSRAIGRDAFVLTEGRLLGSEAASDAPPPAMIDELSRQIGPGSTPANQTFGEWQVRMVTLESSAGAVLWRSDASAVEGAEGLQIDVLASLASAAVARAKVSRLLAEAAALKHGERFLTSLLSSVSHDFRTPIAAVLASATSLQSYGARFDEAVRDDLLATIVEESQRLERYVANILNLTQLEAGALSPRLSPTSLDEVIASACRRACARVERRIVIVGTNTLKVHADPVLLEQTLINVIDNALRFSPPAEAVEIVTARDGDGIEIQINDRGPGVSAAHISRLFDKFFMAPGSAVAGGTGLGLFIARGFVEAMGGMIGASRRRAPGGLSVRISLRAAT